MNDKEFIFDICILFDAILGETVVGEKVVGETVGIGRG
jgi:hypothetical protein